MGRVPSRSLALTARVEAPLRPRRAAALILAIAEHIQHVEGPEGIDTAMMPTADEVLLHADGRVEMPLRDQPESDATAPSPGSVIGRWYHLLLVGREPLTPSDGFEPHLRATLGDEQCALLARSASPSPGQWPTVAEWIEVLEGFCGGQRPPRPAQLRRSRRRSRVAAGALLALVTTATVIVLALAPGWWNDATSADQPGGTPSPLDDSPVDASPVDDSPVDVPPTAPGDVPDASEDTPRDRS